ncbi:MAG: nucleotidyl cyclase domain-containing protein [Planctomycetota bacterium]|jgi:hypothetical protein
MSNERKKRPLDDTATEFDGSGVDKPAPPPSEEPELEVRLPEAPDPNNDDTSTTPDPITETDTSPAPASDGPIELGDTDPAPESPFSEHPDAATRTDLFTGPLDRRVHDPATGTESRMLEVRMDPEDADDAATDTSGLPAQPATETSFNSGETQTEFHIPPAPSPDADTDTDTSDEAASGSGEEAPPTKTDVAPDGYEALKSLSKNAEDTASAVASPTATQWSPEGDTADLEEEDPEAQTVDLPAPDAGIPGALDPEAHTVDLPGEQSDSAANALTTLDLGEEPSTADPDAPPRGEPAFEVRRIEVPGATFVDTFFERTEDDDKPERGSAPVRSSWRDRMERAKAKPVRDFAEWAKQSLDPRRWWSRLRERHRRREGEEPTNKQVAKDAARAIAAWAASVVKPRAELSAEHNAAWWRRTITEIVALFVIVVPIELSLGGSIGSFGTHPHPYWLIVLPMAAARGVVAGLLAAALASILFTIGAAHALMNPSIEFGDIFEFEHMLEPILFFVVAFFTGELHDELASRYKKLSRRTDDVQDRNQSLRQERDVLRDANRELEKRIVDASVQFGNLVVVADRIENAGRAEVFEIALELVEEHCGASASVLLRLEDGSLDYLCHRGWDPDELPERLAIARECETVRRAIDEGRTINSFGAEEESATSGPLVVAPLFDGTSMVKSLLCLDEIPQTRLNESTITVFLGISRWIGAVLARLARNEAAARAVSAPAPTSAGSLWLGSSDELGERLRLELERCARYGVPTSFLAIHLPDMTDTTREGIEAADRFVAAHFTSGLRPSDNVYRFGYPGCYLLVLAGTGLAGAEVVRGRVLRSVQYAASNTVGRIEMFASGPDADAPDLLSLVDRVAARFRDGTSLALEGGCPVRVPQVVREGSPTDLVRRLRIETSLASRFGFDVNVVAIRATETRPGATASLARHLVEASATMLRATDGIYHVASDCIAVVMPSTRADEAATLAHRLVQALRERDHDAIYGDVQTDVVAMDDNAPDAHRMLLAIGFEFVPETSS